MSRRSISKTQKAKNGKFRCQLDDQTFYSKADLDRHIRMVHAAETGWV